MSTKPSPTESREPSLGQTSRDVEMKSLHPEASKTPIPLGEDVMQLARMGEVGAMRELFAAKKFTPNHRDEEGITPLHVRPCAISVPSEMIINSSIFSF